MADVEAGIKPAATTAEKAEEESKATASDPTQEAQEEEPLIGGGTEESAEIKGRQFQKRKSPAKSSIHHRSVDGQNRPLSVHYDDDTRPDTENNRKGSTDNHRFKVDKVSDSDDNHGDSDEDDFYGISSYDTKNLKSFKHYTREALPRVDNYRNVNSLHGYVSRPTLDELHGVQTTVVFDNKNKSVKSVTPAEPIDTSKIVKFGWIQGVLVRCLLNIWGVMLFLRLSWVAAQGGLILGSAVVLLSSVVTIVTTISMSAICTNGEVKNGGTYYMISRSLGPEFGGSIGIIFSLANAIAVAMYTVGFSETVRDLMLTHDTVIFDGGLNDIRLISCITAVILLAIVFIGTEWESKTQMVLLAILLAAMFDFMFGACLTPTDVQKSRGFVGWNAQLLKENVQPDFRMEDFFSVFAVFFPAATGILAGANISGDLKNPSHSIPKGTMLAIIITTISYVGFLAMVTATVSRDANGVLDFVTNVTDQDPFTSYLPLIRNCSLSPTGSCAFGSQNNYQIMELMSWFGPIIYAGIFAATLSSALASLVSAPKVFQALCNDKLFPYIEFFGKGYGVNNEPRRGYLLAFLIAFVFCLMGELNAIAPIISNFFLAAYVIINFSCFHASFAKYPGFRPSYRYYNHWISLLGSFLTLIVMFILSWSTALITFVLILALYLWILHRKPDVNWGSSNQAQTYRSAVTSVYRLNQVPDHVKNYRPQILLLCGNPSTRPSLVDLSYLISKGIGLLTCAQVVTSPISFRVQNVVNRDCTQWLLDKDIKAFYNLVQENSFCQGVKSMIQSYGIGKLRPNIVMLGMKRNWKVCEPTEVLDYFQTFHLIFDKHFSIVVVHLSSGMDITDSSTANGGDSIKNDSLKIYNPRTEQTLFTTKQNKGFIDVWWLFDDGGLTLLLPYIISNQPQWKECKLRIFALVNKKSELDSEQRNMASLLSKFRINYSDVILITDILKSPTEKSKEDFKQIIAPYIVDENGERKANPAKNTNGSAKANVNNNTTNANMEVDEDLEKMFITESELLQFKDKNNRNMRLRELLNEYSKESKLIVMTLPMPRKNVCPPVLYMAWLETLTKNMPPMMLMRGNQTDVLTFYS